MVTITQGHEALNVLIELSTHFPEGVVIFDNEAKKIVHINATAQRITNLSDESSASDLQRLVATLPSEDQPHVQTHLDQVIQGRRVSDVEFKLRSGAKILDICASAYPLLNNRLTLIFVRDITKSKAHENYLIEFGSKKNTTLDGVVHFISGALSLMRNLSGEATKSMHSGGRSTSFYLGLIDKNVSHCLEVVKDILIEEHDKSSDVSVKKSRVNVVDKINYIIDNVRSSYRKRTFQFRHPAREIIAEIDEIKVLQIINNLVFNAIKFSTPDSTITVGIVQDNMSLSVYVADSGIGIPAELKPYIFDRNTRAGRPGLNGEPSFGKGLSICKELARLMGGDISCESTEGKGSIFYLTLPVA